MEKTIENIKKILHIGGAPKAEKKNGKIHSNGSTPEKQKMNHQPVTTSGEINRQEKKRSPEAEKPSVPLAGDELDGEEEDDTLERCGGCRRGMKNGAEITLSGGKCFHFSCFKCEVCSVDVSSKKYAYTGGLLLCEPCIKSAVRTTCHKCILTIEMDDIKLIVDGKEFHQNCFACSECSTKLESVYGSKGGQYYCEGCYLTLFGKKCAGCDMVILGEGLRFGEQNYHRACFSCSACDQALAQGAAHSIKGKPACGECYDNQFKEKCSVCNQVVAEGILFKEQRFHQECFKCRTCGLLLADKKGEFLLTEDGLKCKKCVRNTMSDDLQAESVTEICKSCELPIHVKNLVYDGESYWHHKCFVCGQCNSSLVNTKYYDKNGSLFCNNCFLAEHLPTCFRCGVEIKGRGGVKMHSDSGQTLTWHEDCLQCSVCEIKLRMDNVVFKEKLFCKSCYIEASLNKCDKCAEVITGAGYTFRSKFWHDTCFGCDRCEEIFRGEKLCDNCLKTATSS